MNPAVDAQDRAGTLLTRPRLGLTAGIFELLVATASLVPLDQHAIGAADAWAHLAAWPPPVESVTDFTSNILLQLPFGFLVAGALSYKRPASRLAAVLLSVSLGALTATAIEIAQGMFAARTPSMLDVAAQMVGALGGAAFWTRCGSSACDVVNRAWRGRQSPALVPLGMYVAGWLFWQWFPFDFTLRLPELAQKYRAGLLVILPGAPYPESVALFIGNSAGQWLLALPLGVTASLLLEGRRARRFDAAVLLAVAVASVVQLAACTTLSRRADIGEFAAANLGAVTGVWLAEYPAGPRRTLIAVGAVVALFVNQWAPFQFSAEAQAARLVPFLAYADGHHVQAITQALLKLELGFSVAFAGSVRMGSWVRQVAQWIGVFVLIEVGQLFVPARYPDVTDVLLMGVGAAAETMTRTIVRPRQ